MSLRQIPNAICIGRVALVFPVVWTLTHDDPASTLWLFGAAAVSDGADGFLAKRFGWQTPLGAFLDPFADKLLLVAVFITLAWLDWIPFWLAAVTVLRDAVIVCGAAAYFAVVGSIKISPTRVSKLNTACQLGFILIVICRQAFSFPAAWIATTLGAAVLTMAVISGIDYVIRYSRLARDALAVKRRA